MPSLIATSAVITPSFAMPLMPSVPKNLPIVLLRNKFSTHRRHPRESGDPDLFPAKAGNQIQCIMRSLSHRKLGLVLRVKPEEKVWIPAFARMTLRGYY